MIGYGTAYGKFGELLQGALPGDNNNFLVSLPINRYSTAKFIYNPAKLESNKIIPISKIKSGLLVESILSYLNLPNGWQIHLESQMQEGKGLGSSTADLIASARAIQNATKKKIPIELFLALLKNIEPSDGIMFEGIVSFFHRKVELHANYGFAWDIVIAGVDEGGIIDTVNFNQTLRPYSLNQRKMYHKLLMKLLNAIKDGSLSIIGEVSTYSALLHQEINPKKNLSLFLNLSNNIGALGIIVAHSGTYIGLILNRKHPLYFEQLLFLEEKTKELSLKLEIFKPIIFHSIQKPASYV